jgi:hypothetical protein
MRGTDRSDPSFEYHDTGPQASPWPDPVPVATLRLGGLHAFRMMDDDGPMLVVSDGVTTVEFACGLSGPSRRSARGVQRLADAMAEFAKALTEVGPR